MPLQTIPNGDTLPSATNNDHWGAGHILRSEVQDAVLTMLNEHVAAFRQAQRTSHALGQIQGMQEGCASINGMVAFVSYLDDGYDSGDVLNNVAEADGTSSTFELGGTGAAGDPVVYQSNAGSGAIISPSPILLYPAGPSGLTITGFNAADWDNFTYKTVLLINANWGTTEDSVGSLYLPHEHAGSTAANRIATPDGQTVEVPCGHAILLLYADSRWRVALDWSMGLYE
jgi:hypothetical protein